VPIYEIVLRFPDRDEIRLTDRNGYHVGQEITIAGRTFRVTGSEQPQRASAAGRFVLRPAQIPGRPPTTPLATFERRPERSPLAETRQHEAKQAEPFA